MKRIALFLLLIFAAVQVVPGVLSLGNKDRIGLFFNVDEEKTAEKMVQEKAKEKKEYTSFLLLSAACGKEMALALHRAERILPAPWLEQQALPPNS